MAKAKKIVLVKPAPDKNNPDDKGNTVTVKSYRDLIPLVVNPENLAKILYSLLP